MIIDAHQHFWKYDPVQYAWIDDSMAKLQRDYLPENLAPVLQKNGIDGCITVQADTSEADTTFLLELAAANDFVKGVVGWVDFCAENIEERLEFFADQQKICGFRHVVQAEPDVNFLLRTDFLRGIKALGKYDLTYDILVFPHQLGAALEFVRLFPKQQFVIDHLAKPYIKDGFRDGWTVLMRSIAEFPNVSCKISGLVTEADWQNWSYDDFVPYLDAVTAAFGADRLLFGSDWPVCLVAGDYSEVLEIVQRYTAAWSEQERAKIFGDNALRKYNLA